MKLFNYKLAAVAVAYSLLPICLGCRSPLLERASCQPLCQHVGEKESELFCMPEGLFCTAPADTGEVSEQRMVRPPVSRTSVSRGRCRSVVVSPPLVGSRQSRSQFHPVPTRPVFLPRPDHAMVIERSLPPMQGMPPLGTERLGTPEIELILPEPPPEEIPVPHPEDTDERVTSTPSWIFRASSPLKRLPAREARLHPDSAGQSLRR